MILSTRTIKTLYHLSQALKGLDELTEQEFHELKAQRFLPASFSSEERLKRLLGHHDSNRVSRKRESFEVFRFDTVMNQLRSAVMNPTIDSDSAFEMEWLLRILLTSPKVFESVRELDTFLGNITGMTHDTKNTGRDRIVDWYLKSIRQLPTNEQNLVYLKIAKYLFISLPSNYREWKAVLYGEHGQ